MNNESEKDNKKFYGWTIVATAFVVIFLHLSIRGSFAVFLAPMSDSLGWSTGATAAGLSIFMVFYGLTAFFAGGMVDKHGPKGVILRHGILLGAGLILSSFSKQPWHFYVSYGVIGGIGAGGLYVPPTAMVRKWFDKDVGKAVGIAVSGAGLGFFVAPVVSMFIIKAISWQAGMRIFGIVIIAGVSIASYFMYSKPEDKGLKPYGYDPNLASGKKGEAPGLTLHEALKTGTFWTIVFMYFCSNFAEYIVFSHSVNYVVSDRGFDKTTATYIYSLIGLCFLIFGQIGGRIGDGLSKKYNDDFKARKTILVACYILVAISAAWLTRVTEPWMYFIYVVIYGIPFGIYIPGVATFVGSAFGRKEYGAIWGLTTVFGVAAGSGLGPLVGGALKDMDGNYQRAIWLACIIYIIAAVLAFTAKKSKQTAHVSKESDVVKTCQ